MTEPATGKMTLPVAFPEQIPIDPNAVDPLDHLLDDLDTTRETWT